MKLDYAVNISTAKILRRYGLGEDKAAQRFLAEDVERKCQPYGRAPKHYTGQPLTYHGGALRGKQWDKRMMADHGKEVEKDLEGYLKGRGK